MGKILALDFGLKRTGIAISDESKIFAFGHSTVDSRNLEVILKDVVSKEKIEKIVLGEPKRLNLEDTHISENVRLLEIRLQELFPNVEIVKLDERFTSKMASQAISQVKGKKFDPKKDKAIVDQVSATILLQDYLG